VLFKLAKKAGRGKEDTPLIKKWGKISNRVTERGKSTPVVTRGHVWLRETKTVWTKKGKKRKKPTNATGKEREKEKMPWGPYGHSNQKSRGAGEGGASTPANKHKREVVDGKGEKEKKLSSVLAGGEKFKTQRGSEREC